MVAEPELRSVVEKAVKFGEQLGADEVEAYASRVDRKQVGFTGSFDTVLTAGSTGLGIRVIIGKKTGFFATSSLLDVDVQQSVKAAYGVAKVSKPDVEWRSLSTFDGKGCVEGVYDRETANVDPHKLVQAALLMMDTVQNCNEQLTITRGWVTTEKVETAIANNYGCNALREETFASTYISIKAEDNGAKGVSSESQQTRSWRNLDCYTVAQTAANRVSRIIHAQTLKQGTMPIVWRNKLFASVLRIMFSRTLTADAILKGRSPWIGKIGSRIASENFQLVDDGARRNGYGTRLFDDEGSPQQRILLVDHGVLQGYLYDSYTANIDRRESTGNAMREYHNFPTPTPNNLTLQQGSAQSEELRGSIKRGLYLVETIGAWLSNPISGDLSATATNAFLIENGELTKPVKGIIVTGNFFEILLNRIELIANDTQNFGSTYSPSVKISEMTVISDTVANEGC